LIRDGRLKPLALSATQRSPVLPETPTLAEAGIPGVDYELWWGVFAPAATPAPIIERISTEVARSTAKPPIRARLAADGVVPRGTAPQDFDAHVRQEVRRLAELASAAGLRLQ
jgi:tripartite-type tricarboxylate transporter receptor subunit TctC